MSENFQLLEAIAQGWIGPIKPGETNNRDYAPEARNVIAAIEAAGFKIIACAPTHPMWERVMESIDTAWHEKCQYYLPKALLVHMTDAAIVAISKSE